MKKLNLFVLLALVLSLFTPLPVQAKDSAGAALGPVAAPQAAATNTLTRNGYPPDVSNGNQVIVSSIYGSTGVHVRAGTVPVQAGWAEYAFLIPEPKATITVLRVGFFGQDDSIGGAPDIRVYNWTTANFDFITTATKEEADHYTPDLDPTMYVKSGTNEVRFQVYVNAADPDSVHIKTASVRYTFNRLPTALINPTPSDNAQNIQLDAAGRTLKWMGGDDPDGDPVYYTVYAKEGLDSPAVPAVPVPGCDMILSKTCVLPAGFLQADKQYVWQVWATDNSVTPTWVKSPEWHFKTVKACYQLLKTHVGNGNDPIFSPSRSTFCTDTGYFNAGEKVTLTANPDVGYKVDSWVNTDNNSSTSTINQVTMPPINGYTVAVNYVQACYKLTRTNTGQGAVPVAAPVQSGACPNADEFVYGEPITLTAAPAVNWSVGSWVGTDNNLSTLLVNTLTMPASNLTTTVNYVESCNLVTLTSTGQGSIPSASPSSSPGCPAGKYKAGQVISLTASPSGGWKVGGWSGTNNNASTSTSNTSTMIAAPLTITVNYNPASGTPATLNGSVNLQGRPGKPNNRWITNLDITLTLLGQVVPAYTYNDIPTDGNGNFTLNGISAGTYNIYVKNAHTLRLLKSNVVLGSGINTISLGTLLEGDASDDNVVSAVDFSILAGTFNKCFGDFNYNDTADFNEDQCVTAADFSLLSANYGKGGQ